MSKHGKALGKLTLYLDLNDVSPESVKAHVTGKSITITGNRAEITEENDGMIRCNYHGFTNKFSLPEGTDPNTLKLSTLDACTLVVEIAYRGIPFKSKDTSDKKDLLFAAWSGATHDPLHMNKADSEPKSAMSPSNTNGKAKSGGIHVVFDATTRRNKATSIPPAAVAPIRCVLSNHDGASIFVFNNHSSSQSIEITSAEKMTTE